jgi:hypothetical protein
LTAGPGVYLRLRQNEVEPVETLRKRAVHSLHDGCTSCLFARPQARLSGGKPCTSGTTCDRGQICNEWKVCAEPSQPFNLRLLYRALRVLSTEWNDDLQQATSDLSLRTFERELAQVAQNDVPIALDLVKRSKYFTLVLDQDPMGGIPRDSAALEPSGERESEEEVLWRLPHEARIGIWDLTSAQPLLKLRARADASFIPMGERIEVDESVKRSQQRQVNSCALASDIRRLVESRKKMADPLRP